MVTKSDYKRKKKEVRSLNSAMGKEDLADKYRGVKAREHMARTALESELPEEYTPEKIAASTEIGEWDSNAYALGYDDWSLSMPVEGSMKASMPEVLVEEIGHNIDRGMRPELDLGETEESIYREFAAAVLRDAVFPGNMEGVVDDYRQVNDEIEDFYGSHVELAEEIQQRIPFILENLEVARERLEDEEVESGTHWMHAYDNRLLSNLDGFSLEVEMPGRGATELPNPALLYENHKVGYPRPNWISGSMPSNSYFSEEEIIKPEETIRKVEEDLERTPQEFVDNNHDFFDELVVKAKEEAKFDQAHIVGRELYVRKQEDQSFDVEDLADMSDEDIEQLVTEEARPVIEHYEIDHEEFEQKDLL